MEHVNKTEIRAANQNLPDISGKRSPVAMKVISLYGNGLQFAKTFNPSLQKVCALNKERSFLGEAPSIAALLQAYPEKQVFAWIMAQLENLNDFSGVNGKIGPGQMIEVAGIIETEYYFLKASELLLFFHMLKGGEFGVFYGNIDPVVICRALIEFKAYRRQQLEIYDREIQRKKREEQWAEWERKAVPCPAHLKLAKAFVEEVQDVE
ncbi:DUF6633 family protein [Parabacteroides johnsonii]|uniref:DUF6633 family protein n=1 Tax=Parabacteroides johnsonii TaxID=387661 RepID=UPI0021CB771C|nr:DUF6633 family protein [Parabacteroides johnsonii]